ncbi:hypothetical protein ACIBIZ_20735 [Nonomuraea spiralis]|uniref:hypothetical protein n=1 Tax=Nonomuraea TaxID=83681 RepID=UPI001C8B64DE|nr:hypothetical protein [Nonomuraea sp. WAC 01424]
MTSSARPRTAWRRPAARSRVGGRRPVVDADKRAAILAPRERGESIRTIAAGVKVSVGVVHKTLAAAEGTPTDQLPAP